MACLWHSHPMIRAFGARHGLWCSNNGHLRCMLLALLCFVSVETLRMFDIECASNVLHRVQNRDFAGCICDVFRARINLP